MYSTGRVELIREWKNSREWLALVMRVVWLYFSSSSTRVLECTCKSSSARVVFECEGSRARVLEHSRARLRKKPLTARAVGTIDHACTLWETAKMLTSARGSDTLILSYFFHKAAVFRHATPKHCGVDPSSNWLVLWLQFISQFI
jgi:hypothetical protein